ncbi:MAG: NAD(P)-dependent oxidoreductase [bacterium]|nr:NAD(P)-dependent oxidoreductase [bacterium]
MKIVFLDSATMGSDIGRQKIISGYKDFGEVFIYENTKPTQIAERIKDAYIVITNKCRLNADTLEAAKNLKLICVCATGYDNIDIKYCGINNIAVCNISGYSTDSVAQVTVSMVLALICRLRPYNRYVHSGTYAASGNPNCLLPVYNEISAMKWGIVGLGAIGKKVANVAEALGAEVVVHTRNDSCGYKQLELDELCRVSDIISLHVPLNDETRHMINAERLGMMKKNAVLINVARGAVVDEAAVTEAVITGGISGIGVDVYDGEPIARNSPYRSLYGMDNVIFTPHMAWGSYESRIRCLDIVRENIKSFLNGDNKNRIV